MTYNESLGNLLKDIRFWIVFFFLIRMYGITNPPLEIGQNWRQTDGLMIARNFYEHDANIFYPTVDLAGELTGIVGSELPLLNYIIYLVSAVFGYDHWYGRLIVLIFSSAGVYFFYRTIKKYFGETHGFISAIILMVSLWFSYSRKIVPDVFAASICIAALYFGLKYLEDGKWSRLLLFFVLGLFGCMVKILCATILTVLLIPFLDPNKKWQPKLLLGFFSCLILGGVYAWYFVWVPHLNATYEFHGHFFMGMSFSDGISAILDNWQQVLKRFYDTPLKYIGFCVFVFSVIWAIKNKSWLQLSVFALPFVSFLIMLLKTGSSITGDAYYALTVIPCMAFIAGYGPSLIKNTKLVYILLVAICVENVAAQVYDFRIRQPYKAFSELEGIMDEVSERNDLIAINSTKHYPTPMYFAHRKGWGIYNETFSDTAFMDYIKIKGCKYVVIVKEPFGDIKLDYPEVYNSEYFRIFKLQ